MAVLIDPPVTVHCEGWRVAAYVRQPDTSPILLAINVLMFGRCAADFSRLGDGRDPRKDYFNCEPLETEAPPLSPLMLSQHPDQHRPKRPVLLAVDQELGESAAFRVPQNSPILSARSKSGTIRTWRSSTRGAGSASRRGGALAPIFSKDMTGR
jgi:hypothetical protein